MNSGELLWLKIAFAAAVATVGLLGTLLPWIFGGRGTSERALALSDTFAGGVLGGAGIIHLLSGGLGQFRTALSNLGYPLALLLAGIGFLLILLVEGVIVAGHSGHDSAPPQRASAAVQHEVDWHPDGTRSLTYPVILLIVLSVHSVIVTTASLPLEVRIDGAGPIGSERVELTGEPGSFLVDLDARPRRPTRVRIRVALQPLKVVRTDKYP